jgi:hypothetical protein
VIAIESAFSDDGRCGHASHTLALRLGAIPRNHQYWRGDPQNVIHHARKYLVLSLIVGAAHGAGCVNESEPTEVEAEAQSELSCVAEHDGSTTCPGESFTYSLDAERQPEAAYVCPADLYFHPNNGAAGGWIESWRLCYQGGYNYQICTGGYAPVRYWNKSSCGGTIHDYYPQGWHGWAQTAGGCC